MTFLDIALEIERRTDQEMTEKEIKICKCPGEYGLPEDRNICFGKYGTGEKTNCEICWEREYDDNTGKSDERP